MPASVGAGSPVLGRQAPIEETAKERWKRFQAADWEGRVTIFREAQMAGTLGSDDAFEMLNELRGAAAGPAEQETFFDLLQHFRILAPTVYQQDFGFYNVWLAEDLLARRGAEHLPELLEPFARDPEDFPNQFAQLIRLLLYHGEMGPLLPAMRQAWPRVKRSSKLMGWAIGEFETILSALTIDDYVQSTPLPTADDPGLLGALSEIGERDTERDELHILSLLGQLPAPLRLDDFSGTFGREALFQNLSLLSRAWLGDMYRRHGISRARGELAHLTLMDYLYQRADREYTGRELLVPEPQSLQSMLHARLSARLDAVYDVASLLELLPYYVEFLIRQELVPTGEAGQILEELRGVQQALVGVMKAHDYPPAVIRRIERAWRETAVTTEGQIRHDAMQVDELLAELREAGRFPDQDLLDRIEARGPAVVARLKRNQQLQPRRSWPLTVRHHRSAPSLTGDWDAQPTGQSARYGWRAVTGPSAARFAR